MSITEDFTLAPARLGPTGRAEQLPPSRLAAACTAVRPVDGTGICLFGSTGFPIPIGASDQHTATAERLQFTAGQGPCPDAHSLGCTIIATESLIAQEWPMYYQLPVDHTPFRAITAVPLKGALQGTGTVDFYLHASRGVADLNMTDTDQVITHITDLLTTKGTSRTKAQRVPGGRVRRGPQNQAGRARPGSWPSERPLRRTRSKLGSARIVMVIGATRA